MPNGQLHLPKDYEQAILQEIAESRYRWWAVVGVSLGALIIFLDFTVISTTLPVIRAALHATPTEAQWVVNVFIIVLVLFMIFFGRVADFTGRRMWFYLGLIIYGLASFWAGNTHVINALIGARALQALGGAMVIPTSLALVTAAFKEGERAKALGLWAAISGAGISLGPVIGGLLISIFPWNWIFFINIPFVLISIIFCCFSLRDLKLDVGAAQVDWWGFLVYAIMVLTCMAGIYEGSNLGWIAVPTLALFGIAALSLIVFIILEVKSKSPLIKFGLFINRAYSSSSIAVFAVGYFIWTAFYIIPTYLYVIRQEALYLVGLMLLPITVLYAIFAPFAGYLTDKFGAKYFMVLGLLLFAVAGAYIGWFVEETYFGITFLGFLIVGLAWGVSYVPMMETATSSVPRSSSALASALSITLFNLGGAIGIALTSAFLTMNEAQLLQAFTLIPGLQLTPLETRLVFTGDSIPNRLDNLLVILRKKQELNPAIQPNSEIARQITPEIKGAFLQSFRWSLWLMGAVCAVAMLFVLFIMRNQRRTTMDVAQDVIGAAQSIYNDIKETPIRYSYVLSKLTGAHVYFKLENLQQTGSFKVRGVINKLLSLTPEQRVLGVVAASAGNHGMAVAYGLSRLKLKGIVFVPETTAQNRIDALEAYGARVRLYGATAEESEIYAREYATRNNMTYIHAYNDPYIIAGQGTIAMELTRQIPKIDAVFLSAGGGALAAGVSGHLYTTSIHTRVFACSPENSPVLAKSVSKRRVIKMEIQPTLSNATAGPLEEGTMTLELCREYIKSFILVSEDEIRAAMKLFMENHHLLIEGASGVALAGFLKHHKHHHGQHIVVIIGGANISMEVLESAISETVIKQEETAEKPEEEKKRSIFHLFGIKKNKEKETKKEKEAHKQEIQKEAVIHRLYKRDKLNPAPDINSIIAEKLKNMPDPAGEEGATNSSVENSAENENNLFDLDHSHRSPHDEIQDDENIESKIDLSKKPDKENPVD